MRKPPRRHIPMKTQRDVALRQLGLVRPELDHEPALGLREFDEATGLYTPDECDPEYLVWRERDAHAVKTNGTKATTAGSDKHRIAKMNRMARQTEAFRRQILAKGTDSLLPPGKRRWPSRPLRSRKMEKRV